MCEAGKYADSAVNECKSCTNCQRGSRMTVQCAATGNRQCAACTANGWTTSLNAETCDGCGTGYIRTLSSTGAGSCVVCNGQNGGCLQGQYVNCYTNADGMGMRDCVACAGHASTGDTACSAGYGVTKKCVGTEIAQAPCALCPKGTERPSGTPMVDGIQKCVACGVGKFKAGESSAACGACTNKPGNSEYVAWGLTEAGSNACPWICNRGYYSVAGACQPCPTGQYGDAVGLTACKPCTNAPSGTYYLNRIAANAATQDNTCPWECETGYVKNAGGTACVQCANGTQYREAGQNVATEGMANVCYSCTGCLDSRTNPIGRYMTRECVYNRDRECTLCDTWCSAGQYRTAQCNTTHNRQCQACATRCPAGSHLSGETCSGNTDSDTLLANCRACLTAADCVPGTAYLSGLCAGTETVRNVCRECDKAKSCPGQYRGGCANLSNTRCLDFTACGAGYYLADESEDRDGVCKACSTCDGVGKVRECTKYDDAVCKGSSCGASKGCQQQTSSNKSSLFCDYSLGTAYAACGVCPPGYGSDGQFCLECQRGFTCDRVGRIACRGQCGPGVQSACESQYGIGYAVCDKACVLPSAEFRLAWRGSYVQAQTELCATYFLCTVGYYKFFGTGGSVECKPCNASLMPTKGVLDAWVTEGLSVGDDSSCLWECNPSLATRNGSTCLRRPGRESGTVAQPNAAGSWRNAAGVGGVCGTGLTSQEGSAISADECLACQPLAGDTVRWKDRTDQCEFECVRSEDVRRGSVCVPPRTTCRAEGLVLLSDGYSCVQQSLPWNMAGRSKTAGGSWVVVRENPVGAVAVEYPRMASVGFGIKGRHTVVMNEGGAARAVEGRLCSATQAVRVGNWSFLFGSLCNQSFLVYLNLSASSAGLGVLIGSSTRGWRDGFRTQALFESELYVAARADSTGTVFVLDRWNCLLREVVVWDRPGSYLTRVHTLWGSTDKLQLAVPQPKCYGAGSLAWPRRFWALDPDAGGNWLAFADEDGLWQFDTRTRELLAIVKESAGGFEADGLAGVELMSYYRQTVKYYDPQTLVLLFLDGRVWTVQAAQTLCPEGWTSLQGGGCDVECRLTGSDGARLHWVSEVSGDCLPCTTPVCGRGEALVPCSARAPAHCRRCGNVTGGVTYVSTGTCDASTLRPLPPCEAGWYAVSDQGGGFGPYCERCPAYSATQYAGATRLDQCKCVHGMSRRGGKCVGEALYEFDGPGGAGDALLCAGEACKVPPNAVRYPGDGIACRWYCNAGYYRDTRAGFQSQCRGCLAGLGRTRGDDDSPWSCE